MYKKIALSSLFALIGAPSFFGANALGVRGVGVHPFNEFEPVLNRTIVNPFMVNPFVNRFDLGINRLGLGAEGLLGNRFLGNGLGLGVNHARFLGGEMED